MPGPDRPPPAGPRARSTGTTVRYPQPTPGAPRGDTSQARRAGWPGSKAPELGEETQPFTQPTQGSRRSQWFVQAQAPARARTGYEPVAARVDANRRAPLAQRRGQLRRVGVWSVVKMSLAFYLCVFVVVMVAGVVLWNVAESAGLVRKLDKLVRSLFALSEFQLHPLTALVWGAAAVGALCLLGVLANVVVVVIYNLLADLVGGVRVTVVSEEPTRNASLTAASRARLAGQRPYEGL